MSKVLIVEDDKLVAGIYRNKFAADNFEVQTAQDGESGFDVIDVFQPDVVILDLMLPKVSGLDLLRKIRGEARYKDLPVIVFSNTYLSNMVKDAWKAGATKCLSKANCNPKQLIGVVRGLLPKTPVTPVTPATAITSITAKPAVPARPLPLAARPITPLPSTPGRPAATPESGEADNESALRAVLRQSLLDSLPETLGTARKMLQAMAKSDQSENRARQVQDLYGRVHSLAGSAGIAGLARISQVADAFEALLKELHEKPANINPSTLRTVALVLDFLGVLFERAKKPELEEADAPLDAKILVVDDEALSRRAVTHALEKVKLSAVSLDDPAEALEKLSTTTFDLVFLDVDMPGMNGFELCTKLRALPKNKATPVIFVTTLNGFESRANSMMSGGNDLIAKPFLFMELGLKALVYILRSRLGPAK